VLVGGCENGKMVKWVEVLISFFFFFFFEKILISLR
jgi:hypothetical protein